MPWQCIMESYGTTVTASPSAHYGMESPSARNGKPHGIPWPNGKRDPSFDWSSEGGIRGEYNARNATRHLLGRSIDGRASRSVPPAAPAEG